MKKQYYEYFLFFVFLVIINILSTYAHTFHFNLENVFALKGFSILDTINHILKPENFYNDFRGWSWSGLSSITTYIYLYLHIILHTDIILLSNIFIFFESLSVTLAISIFIRLLYPKTNLLFTLIPGLLFVMSMSFKSDLSNFSAPFFHGQFYGFSDAFGLLALASTINKKFSTAMFLIFITFCFHPIKGIIFGIILIPIFLINLKHLYVYRRIIVFVVCLILSILFYFYFIRVNLPLLTMSNEEFNFHSRFFQHHWYPQDLGIFSYNYSRYILPFTMLTICGVVSCIRANLSFEKKKYLLIILLSTLVLSAIGIVNNYFQIISSLIPLAFHRASLITLELSVLMIIFLLWDNIKERNIIGILIFIAILSFLYTKPSVQGFVVAYIIPVFYILFHLYGITSEKNNAFSLPNYKFVNNVIIVTILIYVFYLSMNWAETNRYGPEFHDEAAAYKDVQIWSKNNTKIDTVFMTDPCMSYGWRDFSERSSFGNLQEWLKTGFIYNRDKKTFDEGIKRAKILGVNLDKYSGNPHKSFSEFCKVSRMKYYDSNIESISEINDKYNVEYFIFKNSEVDKINEKLTIVFENKFFTIIEISNNTKI